MADRIIYKNHCTPQEQLAFAGGSRYYLDSDCGRKLTGNCESKSTSIGTPVTGKYNYLRFKLSGYFGHFRLLNIINFKSMRHQSLPSSEWF